MRTFFILSLFFSIPSYSSPLPMYLPTGQRGLFVDKEGEIRGLDASEIQKTFSAAGVEVSYQAASFPRIELEMSSMNPSCAAAMIKTPKRLRLGVQFLLRFKWNLVLNVYEKKGAANTLKDISALAPYATSIYTFGGTAEGILDKHYIGYKRGMNLDEALRMLKLGRIRYVVASSLSVESSSEFTDGKIEKALRLSEEKAYLVCSRGTSKATVDSLKRAGGKLGAFLLEE